VGHSNYCVNDVKEIFSIWSVFIDNFGKNHKWDDIDFENLLCSASYSLALSIRTNTYLNHRQIIDSISDILCNENTLTYMEENKDTLNSEDIMAYWWLKYISNKENPITSKGIEAFSKIDGYLAEGLALDFIKVLRLDEIDLLIEKSATEFRELVNSTWKTKHIDTDMVTRSEFEARLS